MSAPTAEQRPEVAGTRALRLGLCVQLLDANVYNNVHALVRHPRVGEIRIVRTARVPALTDPKIRFEIVPSFPRLRRFAALYRHCRRLVLEQAVDAILSFNPVPYGLIAAAAARGRVPYHLGFVGTDLYGWRHTLVWKFLRPVLRRADFVSVTGARMLADCRLLGARPESLAILPRTIDLERFRPGGPETADYDFIFLGRLVPIKRVDIILQALAEVRTRHPAARLCVVGDGPLRPALQSLARTLGIADAVNFAGYAADAAPYLKRSRILVLASASEGMPFAIVEGICCGVVPVSTRVGTIDDIVSDGKNGFLVPPRDSRKLAAAMIRLLDDPELFFRMRAQVLDGRSVYADERATAVWDGWFSRLLPSPGPVV